VVHWFGVCGLSNGLAVMADEETRTFWDHITGEAFDGPLAGRKLETWPVQLSTVEAVLAEGGDVKLITSSHRSLKMSFMKAVNGNKIEGGSFLPPGFRRTMSAPIDDRLPELANGLGIIDGDAAKYYPMTALAKGEELLDEWRGRPVRITRGALDGVLSARWDDTSEVPMQLLARWYGFSFTYPGCDLYG